MAEKYKPISCSFYDRLEEAATLKKKVELEITDNGKLRQIRTVIITLMIRNKVEYMLLANGNEVRLDHIHSLDGVELISHC